MTKAFQSAARPRAVEGVSLLGGAGRLRPLDDVDRLPSSRHGRFSMPSQKDGTPRRPRCPTTPRHTGPHPSRFVRRPPDRRGCLGRRAAFARLQVCTAASRRPAADAPKALAAASRAKRHRVGAPSPAIGLPHSRRVIAPGLFGQLSLQALDGREVFFRELGIAVPFVNSPTRAASQSLPVRRTKCVNQSEYRAALASKSKNRSSSRSLSRASSRPSSSSSDGSSVSSSVSSCSRRAATLVRRR